MSTITPAALMITGQGKSTGQKLHRETCKRLSATAMSVGDTVAMGGAWQVLAATPASCCKPNAEQVEAAQDYAQTTIGTQLTEVSGMDQLTEVFEGLVAAADAQEEAAEEDPEPAEEKPAKAPKPEATRRVVPKGVNVAKHYLRWFVREHGPHIARRAVPTVEAKAAAGTVVLSGSKVDVVTAEGELQNYWRQAVKEFEAWRNDPESSYAVARKADRDAGGVPWGKSSRRDEEIAWIASFTSDYRPSVDLI